MPRQTKQAEILDLRAKLEDIISQNQNTRHTNQTNNENPVQHIQGQAKTEPAKTGQQKTTAQKTAEKLLAAKLLSRQALKHKLAETGFKTDEIAIVLNEYTDEIENDYALTWAQKRIRSLQDLPPQVVKRRLNGYLARRGFPQSAITQAIKQVT